MNLESVLKFLKTLKKNNNRDWFERNKARYLEAKGNFEKFIVQLHEEMVSFDQSLSNQDPKKFLLRIYRDVRFSKDKRPYKTNFGASISPTGKGMGRPGYYLQIEPGNSFAAGGLFMPEPGKLAKVRQEIDYNGERLESIIGNRKFKKYYKEFWKDDSLKTAPKGYPKDHPRIDLLKLKSFIVVHEFSDAAVVDKNFLKKVAVAFNTLKPLNDFLNEAIEE